MNRIKLFIKETKIRTLLIITTAAFIFNYLAKLWLDKSQERSQYPVPFFEGQLSFSADKLEEYFNYMINLGTFDIYIKTQFIDFIFIVSILLLHTLIAVLIYRLIFKSKALSSSTNNLSKKSFIIKIAILNIIIAPFAGLFDIIENITLFIIFNDPTNINSVLAFLYSVFAAIKFTIFSISYLWFIFGAIYLIITKSIRFVQKLTKR